MTDGEAESDADATPDERVGVDPERGGDRPDRTSSGGEDDETTSDERVTDDDPKTDDTKTDNDGTLDTNTTESIDAMEGVDTTPEYGSDAAESWSPEAEPDHSEGIDVESLTGPVRRLDPRVRYVWVLGSVMGSLTFGVLAGIVGFFVLEEPLVGPVAFLLVFALGGLLAVLRYRSWSYEVRGDSLYLERGVLTHTRTVVPYVRIQHVDAARGPVERTFGLATVVVYTAGSRGADVSIPGLTTDRADDLQERLKRLAIAAEGEDAV